MTIKERIQQCDDDVTLAIQRLEGAGLSARGLRATRRVHTREPNDGPLRKLTHEQRCGLVYSLALGYADMNRAQEGTADEAKRKAYHRACGHILWAIDRLVV